MNLVRQFDLDLLNFPFVKVSQYTKLLQYDMLRLLNFRTRWINQPIYTNSGWQASFHVSKKFVHLCISCTIPLLLVVTGRGLRIWSARWSNSAVLTYHHQPPYTHSVTWSWLRQVNTKQWYYQLSPLFVGRPVYALKHHFLPIYIVYRARKSDECT